MDADALKRESARRALEFVKPGMKLGLGTGSTAAHFVDLLAEKIKAGLDVIGVPTSEATRAQAERLGVPLTTLDQTPQLDLTVDGADELDAALTLIKGGAAVWSVAALEFVTCSPLWQAGAEGGVAVVRGRPARELDVKFVTCCRREGRAMRWWFVAA